MRRAANLATGLRCRARARRDPMAEFDRLPTALRRWLAAAALPWSPRSARRAYLRALDETRTPQAALARLDAIEALLLARDRLGMAEAQSAFT